MHAMTTFVAGLGVAAQEYPEYGAPEAGAAAAVAGIFTLVWLVLFVLLIAGMWKVFAKAGKPGWAAIIPIYNLVVLLEIAGKPVWWIILMLIPVVNFVVALLVSLA
ncbi:MAG: hypothetical protein D6739_11265, partial [Nitrospirae bacterium]